MSNKDYDKFEKKLLNILNSSTNAKQWSDLLPMTKEILSHLKKNENDIDFSKITTKHMLAKRLAQCLNPEFPNGVHEVVLDIYKILINNILITQDMQLMDNLALYASGLFPFFSHASLQNKTKFLNEIIKDNLLNINPDELTLCFPGLLASLIPGLDDNNDSTTKLIYQAFKDFTKKLTNQQTFYGSYWTLLLRNKHLRTSGIKYLLENIEKYSDLEKMSEEDRKTNIENYYPNINTTVVNALCEIIKDEDIPTVRNGMDFILTRFPLTKMNDMINDEAKINLLINALHLLVKNESSVVRRLNNWILGVTDTRDQVNYNDEDMKYKMNLVVEALKKIFDPGQKYSFEELLNNLKILEGFYENHGHTKCADFILSKISYSILKCVVNYWQTTLNCSENVQKDEIISKTSNFFSKNKNNELLWNSLASKLESIQLLENNNNQKECINCRDTSDSSIQADNHLLNELNEVIDPLKFSLLFVEIKTDIGKIKYYFPIITHLLKIMVNIKLENRENLKDIRQIILITLVFVKSLQDKKLNEEDIQNQLYGKITPNSLCENHEIELPHHYSRLSVFQEMSKFEDNILFGIIGDKGKYSISEEATFEYINKIVLEKKNKADIVQSLIDSFVEYQNYYINIIKEIYLKITKNMQITKYEITIFKQLNELTLRLQEYCQQGELPTWIYYIESLFFYDTNIKISLEAANFIIDLNTSAFNSGIFKKIKNNFYNEPIHNEVIDKDYLMLITQKTGAQNNCYELLMGKLYLFHLEQNNQRNVIDLLVKMVTLKSNKFEDMVKYTISSQYLSLLVEGIKKFSEFWKLTNESYPDLKIFNSGECIFKMVDFLDNKNPLLRHLSKTWLNQVNQKFKKILDPIIKIFSDNQFKIVNEGGQYYFEKEYDTSKILDAFTKLKNIILNSPVVPFLEDYNALNNNENNNVEIEKQPLEKQNYLCQLISIALNFTQAKCKDNLSDQFKYESYGVNAASCEFLEFLVNLISNEKLLIYIANKINKPLLMLLDNAIEKHDEVMQMQLLAVIKILDFNSSIQYENNNDIKNLILSLLKGDILKNVLIKGMTSNYYFVRENFINFTKNCLPIFTSIIDKKQELETIFGIGIEFISALIQSLSQKIYIDKIGRKDIEKFSHFDNENNNVIFKNYLEEYKEYKSYDENDVLLLLKGIKDILLYYLSIDCNEKDESKEKNSFGVISLFKKIKSRSLNLINNVVNNIVGENNDKINWIDFKKNIICLQKENTTIRNYMFTSYDDYSLNESNLSKDEDIIPRSLNHNNIFILLNGLILTWINQSDKYEVYDYCLNINGILAPTEINSWNDISKCELQNAMEMIKNNTVKKIVLDITYNLFISNPIFFIEKLLDIWCFGEKCLVSQITEKASEGSINASVDKQFQLSIIEILISMDIPLNVILCCINQILNNKLNPDNKSKRSKKAQKIKANITPYEYAFYEAKIFHFIYSYILLNPICNESLNIYDSTTEIWREMTNIFNTIINNSKAIYTYCWLYEVMQISLDKFPIITTDNEIVKIINENFNIITTKLIDASFENKVDSIIDGKLVLPTLPHVYTNLVKEIFNKDILYKKDTGGGKLKKDKGKDDKRLPLLHTNKLLHDSITSNISLSQNNNNMFSSCDTFNDERSRGISLPNGEKKRTKVSDFYEDYYKILKKSSEYTTAIHSNLSNVPTNITYINKIYRQMTMITLKENYYKLCSCIYGDRFNDNKKQMTEILKGIISVIKSNDILVKEFASEFLVTLMEQCPKSVTKYGKDLIMNYFNDANFFKTDSISLHNWRKIISHYVECYPEIINDLLNNIDGKTYFLSKTNDADKIRILRRISFVIYSCKKDTFSKQFDLIQAKAKDLLSGYSSNNNSLEIEIFLIMRILFLRFSHEGVMKMIRDLWPIIFTELIQNIENENRNKDVRLVSESFKFIELLSLANIEEFSLYEWIFIMDTYNMNYLDVRQEDSMINRLLDKSNKAFKPLTLNILSKGKLEINDSLLEGKHKGKNILYIRTKKGSFEELYNSIKKFFYSIGDMNSYKVPANYEQIEQIIEEDFINYNNDK
jgi:hypothetical protein